MATPDALLQALYEGGHIGHTRGIAARHLAGRMDIPDRAVRELVSAARAAGAAVCGHPRTGYYVAETSAELLQTIDFLLRRARHSLWLASRMSGRPLRELAGQLLITETETPASPTGELTW